MCYVRFTWINDVVGLCRIHDVPASVEPVECVGLCVLYELSVDHTYALGGYEHELWLNASEYRSA